MHCKRSFAECDKSSAATSFQKLQNETFDKMMSFPMLFPSPSSPVLSERKGWKQRNLTDTAWFQILPLLRDNKRGGSSAQRQVKPPSEVCGVVEGILCFVKSWKSAAGMKAEFRGSSMRLLHKASCAGMLWPRSNYNAMNKPLHAPPCEHRKSLLEMGPGSAKVLNLFSHWREM